MRAVLLSPCRATGTLIFDPPDKLLSVKGNFFPGETNVVISEAVHGQILLAKSSILLNVILTPGRLERSDVEHCRFDLVDWQPQEEKKEG